MKVYLGGPIFNVSRKDATAWRMQAKTELGKIGFEVNDPNMRPYNPGNEVELVTQDLAEIAESDFLIAHVPEDVAMAGTPMEIFYAGYVLGIPVYTFPRNSSPWFIRWSTKSFDNLDELLEELKLDVRKQIQL
jgi:nucleoside 2-deoxyribosyltransferase